MAHEHTQVPENPRDGDVSTCACGVSHAFVELDDGLPGEWVDTTPPDDPSARTPEKEGVRITCTDLANDDSESQVIWNDYCLVAVGSAEVTNIQVHGKSDGTATHVITVKGVRRG